MNTSMKAISRLDQQFIDLVWEHYASSGRDLPWRNLSTELRHRMYQVIVSEIMLQQTQVSRVVGAYDEWMQALPTMHDAARTDLAKVLKLWSGLGYYRRAKYLHEALKQLDTRNDVDLCDNLESLQGIGKNTAGAIRAYVLDQNVVYVETNIRTAIIHHYFSHNEDKVCDSEILEVLSRCIEFQTSSREWYWALMDYGSMLKKIVRINSRSANYAKQSTFSGSRRELRAKVLKLIVNRPRTITELLDETGDARTPSVTDSLLAENLVALDAERYTVFVSRNVH